MLIKLESRIVKSLSECRKLAALFQAVFLDRLIEQDYNNISRILDSIRSEFYSQRCEENEHNLSLLSFNYYEQRCLLLLMSSNRSRSISRIPKRRVIENRIYVLQFYKSCYFQSFQQH